MDKVVRGYHRFRYRHYDLVVFAIFAAAFTSMLYLAVNVAQNSYADSQVDSPDELSSVLPFNDSLDPEIPSLQTAPLSGDAGYQNTCDIKNENCADPVDLPDELNTEVGVLQDVNDSKSESPVASTPAVSLLSAPDATDESNGSSFSNPSSGSENAGVPPFQIQPRDVSQIAYGADYWLRNPGESCANDYSCNIAYVTASGNVAGNKIASNTAAVRSSFFISSEDVYPSVKDALKVGKCPAANGDDQKDSPTCITLGDTNQYAFDIVGFNISGTNYGTCTLGASGAYGDDVIEQQCPNNSIQLFLSNESTTKPQDSRFCSGTTQQCSENAQIATGAWAYTNSDMPIRTANNNLFNAIKILGIAASSVNVQSKIIPRTLSGNSTCVWNTSASCILADSEENVNIFALTAREVQYIRSINPATLYPDAIGNVKKNQSQLCLSSNHLWTSAINGNDIQSYVGCGNGTGQYINTSTSTSVCTIANGSSAVITWSVALSDPIMGQNANCTFTSYREGDDNYNQSTTVNLNYQMNRTVFHNNSGSAFTGADDEHPASVFTKPIGNWRGSAYPEMINDTTWFWVWHRLAFQSLPWVVNPFTREGYIFAGWCDNYDATGNGTGNCTSQMDNYLTGARDYWPKWIMDTGNIKDFTADYWTRSPSTTNNSPLAVGTDGSVKAVAASTNVALRPMMFIDIGKLMFYSSKEKLQVGTCGSSSNDSDPTTNNIHCVKFSDGATEVQWDIAGYDWSHTRRGICRYKMQNDSSTGYGDYNYDECPLNTVALIYSDNNSSIPLVTTKYNYSNTSRYISDPSDQSNVVGIDAILLQLYDKMKDYKLYGDAASPTLGEIVIQRDLVGGLAGNADGRNTGKVVSSDGVYKRPMFAPSWQEVNVMNKVSEFETYALIPDDCYIYASFDDVDITPQPSPGWLPPGVTCDRYSHFPNGVLTVDTDTYSKDTLFFKKRDDRANNLIGIEVKGSKEKVLELIARSTMQLNPTCNTNAFNINPIGQEPIHAILNVGDNTLGIYNNYALNTLYGTVCQDNNRFLPRNNPTVQFKDWMAATVHVPKGAKFTYKSSTLGKLFSEQDRGVWRNIIGSNMSESSWGTININGNINFRNSEGAGIGGGYGDVGDSMEGGSININSGNIRIQGSTSCSLSYSGNSVCGTGPRAGGAAIGCSFTFDFYCSFGKININGGKLVLYNVIPHEGSGQQSNNVVLGLGGCLKNMEVNNGDCGEPKNGSVLNIGSHALFDDGADGDGMPTILAAQPYYGPEYVRVMGIASVIGAPKNTPDDVKNKLKIYISGGNIIPQNRMLSNPATTNWGTEPWDIHYDEKYYFNAIDPQPMYQDNTYCKDSCVAYPNIVPATLNKNNWGKIFRIDDGNYTARLLNKGETSGDNVLAPNWVAGVVWLPEQTNSNARIVTETENQNDGPWNFDPLVYDANTKSTEHSYDRIIETEENLFAPNPAFENCGIMLSTTNNADDFANFSLPDGTDCDKNPGNNKSPTTDFTKKGTYYAIPTPYTPIVWENYDYRAISVSNADGISLNIVDNLNLESKYTTEIDDAATFLVKNSKMDLTVDTGKKLRASGISSNLSDTGVNFSAFSAINSSVNIYGTGTYMQAGTYSFVSNRRSMNVVQDSSVTINTGVVAAVPSASANSTSMYVNSGGKLSISGGISYFVGSNKICDGTGAIEVSSGSAFMPPASNQSSCTTIKNSSGNSVYPNYISTATANGNYPVELPVGTGGLTAAYTAYNTNQFANAITNISEYTASAWSSSEKTAYTPPTGVTAVIWLPGTSSPGTRYDNIKVNNSPQWVAETVNSYPVYTDAQVQTNKKNLIYKPGNITISYNANGANGTVASGSAAATMPGNGTCTYGNSFTTATPTATQNGYTFKGYAGSSSTWTAYVGTASQTIDTTLRSATTTCYGTISGTKTVYSVWHDDTVPVQVAAPTTTINQSTGEVSVNITRTTDVVTPAGQLTYWAAWSTGTFTAGSAGSGVCATSSSTINNFSNLTWGSAGSGTIEAKFTPPNTNTDYHYAICAKDVAGNASVARIDSTPVKIYKATFSKLNSQTPDILSYQLSGQRFLMPGETPVATYSPGLTNGYTWQNWRTTSQAVSPSATACGGTQVTTSNIGNATADKTVYGCWLDQTNPEIQTGDKLSATKNVTNGALTFTVANSGISDTVSGTTLTWLLSSETAGGGTVYCTSQSYATKTCTTSNVPIGNSTVYLTVADQTGINKTSVSQIFKNADSTIDLTLSNNSGTSVITSDTGTEGVKITAKVSPSGTVATKPNGTVSFEIYAPADTSKTTNLAGAILQNSTCTLTGALDANYYSSCEVNFKNTTSFGAVGGPGTWTIVASYSGDSIGLVKSSSYSQTENIQTTATVVSFNQTAGSISTSTVGVNVSGDVKCQVGSVNINCTPKVIGAGQKYYYTIHSATANGYVDYTSSDLDLASSGDFEFLLPQIHLTGTYEIKVFYKGSSVYETSSSSTVFTLTVNDSGIDQSTCIKGGIVINPTPPNSCEDEGGTTITGEFKFAPAYKHSQITSADVDNETVISIKSPDLQTDPGDNGGDDDKSKVIVKLFNTLDASTPIATVERKLASSQCYPSISNCGAGVQNSYRLVFKQPKYLTPGRYYYTAEFTGSAAFSPIDIGHSSANEFSVTKTQTNMTIDSIPDFSFDNSVPSPTGVMAKVTVKLPNTGGYAALLAATNQTDCLALGGIWRVGDSKCGIDNTLSPNWVIDGKLDYIITPDYDSSIYLSTGQITNSDTNCAPTVNDIQAGWRGCVEVDNNARPLERVYYLYLGEYSYKGSFVLDVSFAKNPSSTDISYAASEGITYFNTTVGVGLVEIEYIIGAGGDFVDPRLTNVPKEYFKNGESLTLDKLGGYYSTPTVRPKSGYTFVGWYEVDKPKPATCSDPTYTTPEDCEDPDNGSEVWSDADTPFAPNDFEIMQDMKLYAIYTQSAPGHCSLGPAYTTKEDCEDGGGTWIEPPHYCYIDGTFHPEYDNQTDCEDAGGEWVSPPYACFIDGIIDPTITSEQECIDAGGEWNQHQGPYLYSDKEEVYVGETVTVSGYGFGPNQTVDLFLNSTPTKVATVQVDENGNFCTLGELFPECGVGAVQIIIPEYDDDGKLILPGKHTISAEPAEDWMGEYIAVDAELGVRVKVWKTQPMLMLDKDMVLHEENIEVQGGGFGAEQALEVQIHSAPLTLGIAITDEDGRFILPTSIPSEDSIDVGKHIITATDLTETPIQELSVDEEHGPALMVYKPLSPTGVAATLVLLLLIWPLLFAAFMRIRRRFLPTQE